MNFELRVAYGGTLEADVPPDVDVIGEDEPIIVGPQPLPSGRFRPTGPQSDKLIVNPNNKIWELVDAQIAVAEVAVSAWTSGDASFSPLVQRQ